MKNWDRIALSQNLRLGRGQVVVWVLKPHEDQLPPCFWGKLSHFRLDSEAH